MEGGNLNGSREQSNDSRDNQERQATVVEMMVIVTLVVIATRGGTVFYETSTIMEFGVSMPPPPPPPAPVEPETSPDLYNCWCGREFQIIEELSDHMASHYRHATAETGYIPPPDEGCSSGQLPPKKRQRVEREHKCRICGKRFPTGQALGGHMRAHYQGDLSRPRKNKNVLIASSAASVAVGDHSASMSVNNGYNDAVPGADVVEESTVVELVGDEPGEVSSHPRLDIDLNVKLDEVFEEEQAPEGEAEEDHSDGD